MMGDQNIAENQAQTTEEFSAPEKVLADDFSTMNTEGKVADTLRKSLYVKFDPLVDAQTPQKPEKLLEFDTPVMNKPSEKSDSVDFMTSMSPVNNLPSSPEDAVTFRPQTGFKYTEADLKRKVDQAVEESKQESEFMQMEISELKEKLEKERARTKEMEAVVDEYGQTMANMVEEQNKNKSSLDGTVSQLQEDKEQAIIDLQKTETAFSDLHHKYEKLKGVSENLRKNEKVLKEALAKVQTALKQADERYNTLKGHAEEKIKEANQEIANVRNKHNAEISVANAKLKKTETAVAQLTRQLEGKENDNKELTSICDDLVKQLDQLTAS